MGSASEYLITQPNIQDIRREELGQSLLKETLLSLKPQNGEPPKLPTLLLYDETGLRIFEDITYLDEYYLTNAEIEALQNHAAEIARRLPEGARLVELGSGNLRKVNLLLKAFEDAGKSVEYFALDLSQPELERTLAAISPDTYRHVKCTGLYGTYDDGLSWLESTKSSASATCVMSLGSSIGNFSRDGAAAFLQKFATVLGPADFIMIGLDACQDPSRVHPAYNDKKGLTEKFYRNGLTNANSLLGHEAFKQDDWEVVGIYDSSQHCHKSALIARNAVQIHDISISQGTSVELELAFKYNDAQRATLWHEAGLIHQHTFPNQKGDYGIHLLSPAVQKFDLQLGNHVAPIPGLSDWRELWAAWDTVTRCMTPEMELSSKPILLRNDLIFYLGHIPTFCDIHLSRATGEALSKPSSFVDIFERGIDPDVEDPEVCNAHSQLPESWPPLDDILEHQSRVRERVRLLLVSGRVDTDQQIARAVWLAFEHEAMHLETYLYMLLQSSKVRPPPGVIRPDFKTLAAEARTRARPNQWFAVPQAQLTIGMDDAEDDIESIRYFGWDNEKPARQVHVQSFEAQARPITNGEYANYLRETSCCALPASWISNEESPLGTPDCKEVKLNGHVHSETAIHLGHNNLPDPELRKDTNGNARFNESTFVRTVFGLIPLEYALHWPVMASYNELAGYAAWAGGRIPTLEEARSIYSHVETLRAREIAEKVSSSLISAVNGHLSNNGVEETPPYSPSSTSCGVPVALPSGNDKGLDPHTTFIDLQGRNVGFQNWQPTEVVSKGDQLCGQGDLGGVWEWTSTTLEKGEGFKPQEAYPGYTADFFDGKHNIVLGGSWATHPRIAGRKTFVNWFQRSYPFTWAGARLVRDLGKSEGN